ncbi:MAG TPA: CGGC domain-containing protein [Thermoguttaceae bacterium]|nr:CGGC domain-containing protein [Thermoguttaceae bacterium]
MNSPGEKDYIVVVQCDIVKQRCSGYPCEKAFHHRDGGFAAYPKDKVYRTLYLTCGGCCGRAIHRKLVDLTRRIAKMEKIEKDRIVVHLSSCITTDNYHGPPCPHLDYLKVLIARAGLDVREGTQISEAAEKKRKAGTYAS